MELTNNEKIKNLEAIIYSFSVDVFSFVKFLNEDSLSSSGSRMLLNTANQLYTTFLDLFDKPKDINKIVLNRCEQLTESCYNYLTKINVGKKMEDLKANLIIETKTISKKIIELN